MTSSEIISSEVYEAFMKWADTNLQLTSRKFVLKGRNYELELGGGKRIIFFFSRLSERYSCKITWYPDQKIGGRFANWFRVRVIRNNSNMNYSFWAPCGSIKRYISSIEGALKGERSPIDVLEELEMGKSAVLVPEVTKYKYHNQFNRLCSWVSTKQPIWAYGAAGGGKSHLFGQIAEKMGLRFYPLGVGPTTTESRIFGFMNAGQGAYVEGLLYQPFKNGGLLFIDEGDVLDPQVFISMNAPIANDYYLFPNGEFVKKHENFYFAVGSNTLGKGGMGGYKRNGQDAATLSRFLKVKINYDNQLELDLCRHKSWVLYVQKVRKYMETLAKDSIMVTPRASYMGDKALSKGIPPYEVAEAALYVEMSPDTLKNVLENCGTFTG